MSTPAPDDDAEYQALVEHMLQIKREQEDKQQRAADELCDVLAGLAVAFILAVIAIILPSYIPECAIVLVCVIVQITKQTLERKAEAQEAERRIRHIKASAEYTKYAEYILFTD